MTTIQIPEIPIRPDHGRRSKTKETAMTETTAPTISDAAVEAAWIEGGYSCRLYRDNEQKQRDLNHITILLEAAYPFIAAEVRRQMLAELRGEAKWTLLYLIPENERLDPDRPTTISEYEMSHLIDWLHEQETK